MAILTQDDNKVEVKIKRFPQGTDFNEYVKIGDREKRGATSCERYIIPEPGTKYAIEITLKKGYLFGPDCNCVKATLYLPGVPQRIDYKRFHLFHLGQDPLAEDVTRRLEFAEKLEVGGVKLSGARLAFREILIGKLLPYVLNVSKLLRHF
jgi:hypothetical protein